MLCNSVAQSVGRSGPDVHPGRNSSRRAAAICRQAMPNGWVCSGYFSRYVQGSVAFGLRYSRATNEGMTPLSTFVSDVMGAQARPRMIHSTIPGPSRPEQYLPGDLLAAACTCRVPSSVTLGRQPSVASAEEGVETGARLRQGYAAGTRKAVHGISSLSTAGQTWAVYSRFGIVASCAPAQGRRLWSTAANQWRQAGDEIRTHDIHVGKTRLWLSIAMI